MRSRAFDSALFWGLFFGSLCIVVVVMPAAAATPESFVVKTTSDYVTLCETPADQPNYAAAFDFCQGFANGAYLAVAIRPPKERFICLPDPPPLRNEVLSAFAAWTRANPDTLSALPVNSVLRFLGHAYPCNAQQAAK
jgi:hypothetical protein